MASKHWRNCDFEVSDGEIAEIDALEERLETEGRDRVLKIRRLITSFEVCHHNSLRWAERIVHAITDGEIQPTSGRKRIEHPVSIAHLNLRELLASIADAMEGYIHKEIPGVDANNLGEKFGNLSDRKRWLIKLVLDNLEYHLFDARLIPVMRTVDNRLFPGGELNVESDEDAKAYFSNDYEYYKFYSDVTIHMVDDLHPAEKENWMPLLLVIQFANPCSVNYFQFVSLLLEMISGTDVNPEFPFPFCGHYSERQYIDFSGYISTCQSYLDRNLIENASDKGLFGRLDNGDLNKRWLVASFEKTLRLQLGY